ncbi:MAG: ABC transporter ATP-binding protein [Pseudomonadota bacterium]
MDSETRQDGMALALAGVQAYYGDSHILHDVSFGVGKGQLLALLGRNGAGKSTSIHAIAGLRVRRGGSIRLMGREISGCTPEQIALAGLGLVPQGRRIFASLTVRENLEIGLRQGRGGAAGWDLARIYARFPRLRERQGQGAGSLSGGEQQLLAIARALLTNPAVLLLDEPSEGLSPHIVTEVQQVIQALKAEGLSIILVEQNIRFALEVADTVVILNTGRVVYRGSSAQLRADQAVLETQIGIQ